jgi:hypothetical protein
MLGDLIALLFIGSLALAPIVWRARRDKRQDAALRVQAGLQFKANQRLGGESFLVVSVEPAPMGGKGRVRLSTPDRWQWLVGEVWNDVATAMPPGYELVLTAEMVKRMGPVRPDMVPARRIPPRGQAASAAHG